MLETLPPQPEDQTYEKAILDRLETLYTKALRESKKTGLSVESTTYEILEGLEEALHQHGLDKTQVQTILHHASESITEVIHTCAQESVSHSHHNLMIATQKLQETIEAEKAHLLESMEAFRAYAKDHAHVDFEKKLSDLQQKLNQLLHTVTEKIREHTK